MSDRGCGYDGLRHYTGREDERPYARCPRCLNYLSVIVQILPGPTVGTGAHNGGRLAP